jgi:CRP-like cAMP-binding protein
MDRTEIIQFLENCELFKGLRENDIQQVSNLCRMEAYAVGDTIFRQGDLDDQLYVVAEGHVFLERIRDLGMRKGHAVIGMLSKGKVFGCWSTLLDEKHTLMCSAVCRKPTKVLVFKGPDLRQMMRDDHEFGFSILERLCFLLRDRLMGAYEAMEEI